MRHRKRNNHLGRKSAHRGAMLSNMATSLIMHKRIFTTVPKAKELRKFVEPIITVSKEDTTNARRNAFSKLQNKYAVTELFQTVSQKVGDRPGGYTRIIKTGNRLGDNASMCFIELVDFNENMLSESTTKKARTRRSRRGGGSAAGAETDAKATDAKATKKESSKKDTSNAKSEAKIKETKEVKEPVEVKETEVAVEEATEVKETEAKEETKEENKETESSDN
ncbi:MAG: 50S ribosomal protein L17 [Bacteroidales bacterium]|jgi:large subunit ribosomal protein L17|nr:50S ribosomal protein L17 [Bacteroidales bacterium]